jgi:hypothetical protein
MVSDSSSIVQYYEHALNKPAEEFSSCGTNCGSIIQNQVPVSRSKRDPNDRTKEDKPDKN